MQNIRADERPLFDALAALHQQHSASQPETSAYLEALAAIMREYLIPAAHDVVNRHIILNRRELQEMHTIDAWRVIFESCAVTWLDQEYIPTRTEQIASTLATYGEDAPEKAYTQSRAAMLAVTFLADMGMVDTLCGLLVLVLSRRQAVLEERQREEGQAP